MFMQSEQDIQSAIVELLDYYERQGKLFFFRSASGAVKTESGRYFKTGRAGVADLTVCAKGGKFIALEVKRQNGRQSEAQRLIEGRIKSLGGAYYIVHSVDEAVTALEHHL